MADPIGSTFGTNLTDDRVRLWTERGFWRHDTLTSHLRRWGRERPDKPAFVEFLVAAGIDCVSVTPDSFVRVKANVAAAEAEAARR